jgi:hypothetical protein
LITHPVYRKDNPMNIIPDKTPARDASGVPAELRALLEVLAELSDTPGPADHNWDGYHQAQLRRRSLLNVRLTTLADELAINDKYPSVAAEQLARHCQWAIQTCREELAKPLGYEPYVPEAEAEEARR